MNPQWQLARTPPAGWPSPDDFSFTDSDLPTPGPGQALTKTVYLSMDPYQWGRRRSGTELPGEVCHGRTVSQVLQSHHAEFKEGDIIFNTNGWQAFGLVGTDISVHNYMFPRKIDPALAPISTALGVLGMLGLTAYSGLYLQCQPQAGETALISAASGGVGQNAVQIARIKGCHVVGIAGSEEKCRFVTDVLGADACVNHRSDNFAEELIAACPDGVDIYFENVGGAVFEAVLPLLNPHARITLCGLISQYGNSDSASGHRQWRAHGQPTFDKNQVTVHGLFVGNFVEQYQDQFLDQMAAWVRSGEVVYREHRVQGLANAYSAFAEMLGGGNFGKTLVVVSEEP